MQEKQKQKGKEYDSGRLRILSEMVGDREKVDAGRTKGRPCIYKPHINQNTYIEKEQQMPVQEDQKKDRERDGGKVTARKAKSMGEAQKIDR